MLSDALRYLSLSICSFSRTTLIFVHSRLNSTCRSLVMLVSLFVSVRVYVSVCLSICLSVFLSICVCVSVCVYVCVCVGGGMSLCFAVIPADSASWRMRCVAKVTKIPPKHLQDYGSTAASPAHPSMTDCQGNWPSRASGSSNVELLLRFHLLPGQVGPGSRLSWADSAEVRVEKLLLVGHAWIMTAISQRLIFMQSHCSMTGMSDCIAWFASSLAYWLAESHRHFSISCIAGPTSPSLQRVPGPAFVSWVLFDDKTQRSPMLSVGVFWWDFFWCFFLFLFLSAFLVFATQ